MPNTITNILIVEIRSEVIKLISDDADNTRSKLVTALINKQTTDTMPATDPHFTDAKFLLLKRRYKTLIRINAVMLERIFIISRSTIGKGLLRAISASFSALGAMPSERRTTISVIKPNKECTKAAMPPTF